MRAFKAVLAVGMVLALLPVSGCGKAALPSASTPASLENAPPAVELKADKGSKLRQMWIKKLGLSESQLAQLKAIKLKYHEKYLPAGFEQLKKEGEDLLLAPDIDEAALKAFLEDRYQYKRIQLPLFADMLEEARGVLLPEQIDKLTNALKDQEFVEKLTKKPSKVIDKLFADIELTPAQEAALEALKDKLAAMHSEARMKTFLGAVSDFMEFGGKAALNAKMGELMEEDPPIDEVVALMKSLELSQRTALVDKVELWLARHAKQ